MAWEQEKHRVVSHVVLKFLSASYHLRRLLENVLCVCEWSWTCPVLPGSHCCQPITALSQSDHPRRAVHQTRSTPSIWASANIMQSVRVLVYSHVWMRLFQHKNSCLSTFCFLFITEWTFISLHMMLQFCSITFTD